MNNHSNPFEKKSSKERLADELEKRNVYLIPEQFSVMSLPNYYAASESPKPRPKKRPWSFIIMFIVIWIELLIMTAVAVTMVVLKLKLKGLLIFLTVGWIIIVIEVAVFYVLFLSKKNIESKFSTNFIYKRKRNPVGNSQDDDCISLIHHSPLSKPPPTYQDTISKRNQHRFPMIQGHPLNDDFILPITRRSSLNCKI
ncbi:hypothetical protein CONCODRAFT_69823 [Conidiobolus coronatus NRRL 28638]|uniref:Uncharacterized protein n=1 Tax=Conidiobolus coronatus (strain ATCC 28846 / CBS 209.66 / NRRL 28638) TaxID=796925 RepID=A0A137P8U4_CONC2|nr:hypothetical protein CONCODRAFT_69823 [Conidiobolus coronatus NRRL 28638]|eukprot:KXN71428.1 hypothetical protein CONCODRAFT_69823 [Conidiobolus coronatus NRRL 28638]